MKSSIKYDALYGPALYAPLTRASLIAIGETAIRTPIQYHTLQGYLSELEVFKYLLNHRGLSNVRKVSDTDPGHHGDVSFSYRGQSYSAEVKTVTIRKGKGLVSFAPTRKSDLYCAYRRGDFDLLIVRVTNTNDLLFCHTRHIPNHKKSDEFLRASLTIKESNDFFPFVTDLKLINLTAEIVPPIPID